MYSILAHSSFRRRPESSRIMVRYRAHLTRKDIADSKDNYKEVMNPGERQEWVLNLNPFTAEGAEDAEKTRNGVSILTFLHPWVPYG